MAAKFRQRKHSACAAQAAGVAGRYANWLAKKFTATTAIETP